MTTSDPNAAVSSDRTSASTATPAPLASGVDTASPLSSIDDATLDRIAGEMLKVFPAASAAPIPALRSAIPGVAIPPTAGVAPPLNAPPAGVPIPAAGAAIPATAIPGATEAIPPLSVPSFSADGMDGALPRLFDDNLASRPPAAASTPGYYFLTPTLATVPAPLGSTPLAPAFYRRTFDVRDIRRDFPILQERVHGRPLVWLDNAATTQKPRAVIDRLVHYYEHEYSNVHRAAHTLAARSTDAYEGAREKLQRFIGAASPEEIVFVRGTTEAINLVAQSWGRKHLGKGDEIVLTTLEHHSNIVPWQFLIEEVGAVLRVVPVTDRGEVLLGDYEDLLGPRTRMVALTHVSNALGTILPVREMIQSAHRWGARVLIDGAQAVSHFPVNVQELDADFYVFSGHKMFGPSGVGVMYGKKALLDEMPPWQGGGNMIQRVTFEKSTFADPPARFEAGTATLGPAVGLGAAVDYLERIGMENVARHERELLAYATESLSRIPGVHLIGTAPEKAGVLSFIADGITIEDLGRILDQDGIAVRAGHHCAQPTMDRFGLTGTVRPSLALYNTHDEIDVLERAVRRALRK
jgi:cysteine desulfurase/selenocysteine lyase